MDINKIVNIFSEYRLIAISIGLKINSFSFFSSTLRQLRKHLISFRYYSPQIISSRPWQTCPRPKCATCAKKCYVMRGQHLKHDRVLRWRRNWRLQSCWSHAAWCCAFQQTSTMLETHSPTPENSFQKFRYPLHHSDAPKMDWRRVCRASAKQRLFSWNDRQRQTLVSWIHSLTVTAVC